MADKPQNTALTTTPDSGGLAFVESAVRTFDGINQLAELMARMGTMPKHLAGKPADCFRIVVQAAKWHMDPFAVAECTSLVHGRMCYEGKLVAAVLTSLGAIDGRLSYEITGKGQAAEITVTGTPRGGKPVSLRGTVKEWRTHGDGSPWDKQPEVQLVYRGTRQWARMYAPEALLGVYTPDEIDTAQEAEGVVVHRDPPPARTGAAEQQQAPADPAPAQAQEPAKPATAPAHPAIAAARDLYRAIEKAAKGAGNAVIARLCALHGAGDPKGVPAAKLDAFGKDVAELGREPIEIARIEDLLATWEQAAREGGEAKP